MEISVNYLAIFLAAVANMAIGFAWYSPMILGKQWMKEKGFSQEALKKEQSSMGKYFMLSFMAALVTGYVLSHVITFSGFFFQGAYTPLTTGLMTAFWSWLGFIMPVQATHTIFGDKNWKLLGIDTGYQLVALLAMGFIIGYMM